MNSLSSLQNLRIARDDCACSKTSRWLGKTIKQLEILVPCVILTLPSCFPVCVDGSDSKNTETCVMCSCFPTLVSPYVLVSLCVLKGLIESQSRRAIYVLVSLCYSSSTFLFPCVC